MTVVFVAIHCKNNVCTVREKISKQQQKYFCFYSAVLMRHLQWLCPVVSVCLEYVSSCITRLYLYNLVMHEHKAIYTGSHVSVQLI